MVWLLVATLSGTMVLGEPRTDPSLIPFAGGLPRPSRAAIDLLLHSPERRVRTTHPRLMKMLELGAKRSVTFAGLLAAIGSTDVIVYIEPSQALPSKLDGRLLLIPLSNHQRYLRIQVRADLPREDLVSLIGHELRHALEIAANPGVRDDATMLSLYQRIGEATAGAHAYDTAAARSTGKRVRLELNIGL